MLTQAISAPARRIGAFITAIAKAKQSVAEGGSLAYAVEQFPALGSQRWLTGLLNFAYMRAAVWAPVG